MTDEMLTTKEAAAYLGLSVSYVYKLNMQKKLPRYKPFGNICYYKREDLDKILQSNRISTVDELQSQAVKRTLAK